MGRPHGRLPYPVIEEPPNRAAVRRLQSAAVRRLPCAHARVSREQIELSAAFIVALSDLRVAPTLA